MTDEGTNSTLQRRNAISALISAARSLAGQGTKIVIVTLRDGNDPAGISVADADPDVPPLAILGPGGDFCMDITADTKGTTE